jgi:hypothetical protein
MPPRRPERVAPDRVRQPVDAFDEDDEVMPWTGPSIYPVGPGRRERRPPSASLRETAPAREPEIAEEEQPGELEDVQAPSDDREPAPDRRADTGRGRRAAAARSRKYRRRLIIGGPVLVVVVVVVLAILGKLPFEGGQSKPSNNGLVTNFQPGEFRSVPNACHAVSQATLSTYLPGKIAVVSQSLGSSTQSQCTWTLDSRPVFRVLTVTSQAYTPSLLTSGDGSATSGAVEAYNQQLRTLSNPPKSSNLPKAQIGGAVGLGNSSFTALQVFQNGGDTSDEVTVVVRDRNVVVTVTMQGQESGGGYGPVPDTTLRAAALAAAHEALAGLA